MRIGIDLGGSHIGIGLVLEGNILEIREKVFTQQDKKDIKKAIIENTISIIDEILLAQNIDKKEIELIGIASPGLISGGSIVKASNLSIFDFNICEEIEKMTGIKTQLRNDAKCAAICEKEYGALKEYTDCIFLSLGTGIGGAAFIDGKLLEPNGFSGFEFGHMVIEKDGILCTCGKKGCFERYCSIKALKNRITEALHISNDVSGKYLREEILNRTDKEIDEEIDEWIDYLRIGLGNLIDIFEPKAICFGGSFAHYEDTKIMKKLKERMKEPNTTFTTSKSPDIVVAKYQNSAGIIGATLTISKKNELFNLDNKKY